jgi:mRNA interferase HigB
MRLIGKKQLEKLKRKNKGNTSLVLEINNLIIDIEENNWKNPTELKAVRKDADCVHSDGFYFFNISIHRTLILIEFEEDGDASVVWVGNHQEYEKIFKNNKSVIKKWLKSNNWI